MVPHFHGPSPYPPTWHCRAFAILPTPDSLTSYPSRSLQGPACQACRTAYSLQRRPIPFMFTGLNPYSSLWWNAFPSPSLPGKLTHPISPANMSLHSFEELTCIPGKMSDTWRINKTDSLSNDPYLCTPTHFAPNFVTLWCLSVHISAALLDYKL